MSGQPLVQTFLGFLVAAACALQLLNGQRQLVWQHGEEPHAAADGVLQASIRFEGASAAHEFHAEAALEPLDAGDGDHAYRARAFHVRPAAGRKIVVLYLDDAELAFACGILSERELAASAAVTNRTHTSRSSHSTALTVSSTLAI